MHDMKSQPQSSFITPTSKTPVKRSSNAEIIAKLEKWAAYLQQDDLTAVGAAIQAYYQRQLAAAAQEQDLPTEEIDSQKENQPSLVLDVQAKSQVKSIDVQQSSISEKQEHEQEGESSIAVAQEQILHLQSSEYQQQISKLQAKEGKISVPHLPLPPIPNIPNYLILPTANDEIDPKTGHSHFRVALT